MKETTYIRDRLEDAGFFHLRTPLLPFDEFLKWSDGLQIRATLRNGANEDVERALAGDVQTLRARLRSIIEKPEVLQALFIASPSLESSIEQWKRDPDSKKGTQTERSLVRYFARMCGRSTPFGLFSGCSLGLISTEDSALASEMSLAPREHYRSSSRLDFGYLFALTNSLRKDQAIVSESKYWPNSSLHRIGDTWHYVESKLKGAFRSHHLVKLYADPFLDCLITRALDGAFVFELMTAISTMPEGADIAPDEIDRFIRELISSEVLISSLSPQVTGAPALEELIAQLEELPSAQLHAHTLRCAAMKLKGLDNSGLGVSPAEYRQIATDLESVPVEVEIAQLFQVDLLKPSESLVLTRQVTNELLRAVEMIGRISEYSEPEDIKRFRDVFQARYDGAWVPLLQVLDEDVGIGFGSTGSESTPLLQALRIGDPPQKDSQKSIESLLEKTFRQSPSERKMEVVIDESELPIADNSIGNLADCFDFQFSLIASSMQSVREGNYQILFNGCSGPSGVRLLGRFCHADPELEARSRALLRAEEALNPDVVFAEVIHLPEGRIGNVLSRPVLREYEISYLGRSGAPLDRQIPASDLLVSVTRDGSIQLYSKRLNRRVVPRLSNAHTISNPRLASVYRFLCSLQHQNGVSAPTGFHWGGLRTQCFLPRLRIGRVVLSCARWMVSQDEVKKLDQRDRKAMYMAVQQLRESLGLPRWVLLAESDNKLPVDLDNILSVDSFVHVIRRKGEAILSEMYPSEDQMCVVGPEGRFRHEILLPVIRRMALGRIDGSSLAVDANPLAGNPITVKWSDRRFPPGGNWFYVKIYGGSAVLDDLLVSEIPLLLGAAREKGAFSRWFFLRYADPHLHLRIRFLVPAGQLIHEMPALIHRAFGALINSGKIWKISFDTYDREVERYGGVDGIEVAEDIFCADSEAVLEILKGTEGDEGLEMRWRIAIQGVNCLLSDCGFGLATKHSVVRRLRDEYRKEFHVGRETERAISDRFRRERRKIEALFGSFSSQDATIQIANKAFAIRSEKVQTALRRLSGVAPIGASATKIAELAESYVHMHVNRIIRSSQRAHELVIYDFLSRYYEGELAKLRRSESVVLL